MGSPAARLPRSAPPSFCARASRHVGRAVAALCLLTSTAHAGMNQTKANMLWNLAKFVEWPAPQNDPKAPIVFTILGEDELAGDLAGVLSSKMVNGRPVFVRFARRPQDAKGSQILYVAATELPHMTEALAAVDSLPVLTVSDVPGFAAHGGMVGFMAQGDKVHFEVNRTHAEKTGLKLSAKLLALAHLVGDSPEAP